MMMNSRTTVTAVLLSCLAFHQHQHQMTVVVDGFVAQQPLHQRTSSLYSENPNPNFPPPPGAVGANTVMAPKPTMESRSTQVNMNEERSNMRINNNPTNNIRDPVSFFRCSSCHILKNLFTQLHSIYFPSA